jgi:hypothetical protein
MRYIMILNDGETYTDLQGCTIAEVPDYFDFDSPKGWGYPVVAEFAQVDGTILVMERFGYWTKLQVSQETLRKGT